ncbi:hypothetical protein ACFPH8_03405 [Bizionia hallyeonensis]|uniref:PH domain-containing protein n=1 Tax=Bizionia hallyeonensis TaxID=1123757 RepID=A0ABW0C2Y4_9FLAO
MSLLTIKYKKKRLYANLILGLVWTGLGVFNIWESDNTRWSNILTLLIGIIYIGMSLWEFKKQYLTITDIFIKENSLFGKKLLFKDLTHIKKFTDEYTLKTQDKTLGINSSLMDHESKIVFENFIATIEFPK